MVKHIPLFLLVACGGGASRAEAPAPSQPAAPAASPGPAEASVDAFHDVLAPLWHAPQGTERTEKTCSSIATLEQRAQELGDAPLVESVRALAAECGGDRAGFEARFADVHTAFHAVMEKGGAPHGEHEHHGEPGHHGR